MNWTRFAETVAHDCDQLQQQLDALRAEVERLRGQSKAELLNAKQSQDAWSEALKLRDSARARAEAAERERDEAQAQTRHWREAAVKENERAMEYLNAAAEAQAHAADLRGALEKIVEMNRQNSLDKYGDPDKAEQWSCVRVGRAALAIAAVEAAPEATDANKG